jgi:hypothetical protein
MIGIWMGLAVLSWAPVQESVEAPWRTDVRAAREAALREGRPCVIFLFVDSL